MHCLFPGHFQPFHNGHLLVIKGMVKACPKATIVISENDEQLFSTDKVREMITGALMEEGIMDAGIAVVKESDDLEAWADAVVEAGDGDEVTVWSGDPEVLALFEARGVPVKKIVPVPGISSDVIREQIISGDSAWRSSVPGATLDPVMDYLDAQG
jgi:nicotinamide-nucleotide adenylyltransferase